MFVLFIALSIDTVGFVIGVNTLNELLFLAFQKQYVFLQKHLILQNKHYLAI